MERPRASSVAWAGLIGGVAAYDILCPRGETLSERLDDPLETRAGRLFVYAAVGAVALHLTNLLPESVDPFHHASEHLNKLKS